MSKNTKARKALSPSDQRAVEELGERIRVARKRRGQTLEDLANRMLVSSRTLWRLETGDPGVSIGVLVSALSCMGLESDLSRLADPGTDDIGQRHDRDRLARVQRVRPPTSDDDLDF